MLLTRFKIIATLLLLLPAIAHAENTARLNGNPLETNVMNIVRISVAKTMMGGKLTYEEGAR